MAKENQKPNKDEEIVWKDRKHFMWFPITFTKYCVRRGRVFVDRGLINSVQDQTLLYRIIDIQLRRSLSQKIFGTGTIVLVTKADMEKEILLESIKNPNQVCDLLSDMIEEIRHQKNVVGKEFYGTIVPPGGGPGMMPDEPDFDHDPDGDMDDDDGDGII